MTTFTLPEARYAKFRFMRTTLKTACKAFNDNRQHGEKKISLSAFQKLRPRNVKLVHKIPSNTCLCQECLNLKLLSKGLTGAGMAGVIGSTHTAVEYTICEHDHLKDSADYNEQQIGKYGYRSCLFRECSQCGQDKMKAKLEAENEDLLNKNPECSYHIWESNTKNFKGKEVTRIEKVLKVCCLKELLHLYVTSLGRISSHLFLSKWQYKEMVSLTQRVKKGHVVINSDYSQNIECANSREVQASYFDRTLITFMPSVLFYACPVENCTGIVRHEYLHFSSDLKHDFWSYKKFSQDTLAFLRKEIGMDIDLIVNLTDQAPQTYKNKNVYLALSESEIPTLVCYTASSHGKFFSDTAQGRFKLFLRRAIATQDLEIRNLDDITTYAQEHYCTKEADPGVCQHFRINVNAVNRIPRGSGERSKTAEGTRQFHSVRNMGCDGLVKARAIACLCDDCLTGDGTKCINAEFCTEWTVHQVSKKKPKKAVDMFWPLKKERESDGKLLCEGDGKSDTTLPKCFQEVANDVNLEDTELNVGQVPVIEKVAVFARTDSQSASNETKDTTAEGVSVNRGKCADTHDTLAKEEKEGVSCHLERQCNTQDDFRWSETLLDMQRCETFRDLKCYCLPLKLDPVPKPLQGMFMESVDVVDEISCSLLPLCTKAPGNMLPVSIIGDGNCLPRTLSKIAKNDQKFYTEFRVRLIHEAVINERHYLNPDRLRIASNDSKCKVNYVEHYSQYSSKYDPSKVLDKRETQRVYREEWMEYRFDGIWSGPYQLHCGASILDAQLFSHFSNRVISSIHHDLNRCMVPIKAEDEKQADTCHILWTKSSGSLTRLDHFVPLLPLTQ